MKDLFSAQNEFFTDIQQVSAAKQIPLIDCGDGVSLRILTEVTEEDFARYTEEMQTEYPSLRIESIADNQFLSVQHDDGYLYAMYFPSQKELRLFSAETGHLIPDQLAAQNSYVGKKTVTQIAPDIPTVNFGMCYIFSLGEGHFLVYDGLGSNGSDEEKLFASLKSMTPEGEKPVIDAWILTHPHFDHIAGVHKFALRYHDDVTVRHFVMNMANPFSYPVKRWREMVDTYAKWLPELYAAFPEAKIWKVHTGQTFYVADAKVEVLYTQEECPRDTLHPNDASLMTRVFIADKTLIFPADITGEYACRLVHELYGGYLKSDYYQLAHHAWDTDVLLFYYDIDPTHMLWPLRMRDWDREHMWTFPATKVYKKELEEGARQFHIAMGEDIVLPLD